MHNVTYSISSPTNHSLLFFSISYLGPLYLLDFIGRPSHSLSKSTNILTWHFQHLEHCFVPLQVLTLRFKTLCCGGSTRSCWPVLCSFSSVFSKHASLKSYMSILKTISKYVLVNLVLYVLSCLPWLTFFLFIKMTRPPFFRIFHI